ncbi:PREDICTED: uncharacterized protein LOC104807221 [Tarenaya hassleriana]|uniref:uncharacterized protein LOC104807221 n=1 Tax=Tarenaya hassleriana TaxID=28532 RepID=UPI00053C41E6|nr:PREDICTED: uncharacterized protein LOC104807221 [Tarenaya hassleriana]
MTYKSRDGPMEKKKAVIACAKIELRRNSKSSGQLFDGDTKDAENYKQIIIPLRRRSKKDVLPPSTSKDADDFDEDEASDYTETDEAETPTKRESSESKSKRSRQRKKCSLRTKHQGPVLLSMMKQTVESLEARVSSLVKRVDECDREWQLVKEESKTAKAFVEATQTLHDKKHAELQRVLKEQERLSDLFLEKLKL